MTCPFCDDNNIQPIKIYKDDLVMAFPTNIPIVPGHTLVCSARHVSKIDQLSDGKMAGQAIDHLHIHVVPRKTGDAGIYEYEPRKFLYRPGSRNESPRQELQEVAELIKKSLA